MAEASQSEIPLQSAGSTRHRSALESLIEAGSDVNAKDDQGNTTLHIAVQNDHLQSVRKLIDSGAELELKNAKGETPLYCSTIKGDLIIMKILIDAGASVNTADNYGNSGGHHASFNGRYHVVKLLLDNGFEVDYRNNKEYTPLHFAARENHPKLVQLLTTHGADIEALCRSGDSPIMLAARLGHDEIVFQFLVLGASILIEKDGRSILHKAALGNRLHTIQSVMTKIPSFDKNLLKMRWNEATAEDYANNVGSSSIASLLAKQLPRAHEEILQTPIYPLSHQKCRSDYEKSGSNIIKRAGMNVARESNWLLKSIKEGDIEMHYMDEQGNTILHAAAAHNNILTVQKLLDVGALTVARNYMYQTPFDIAVMKANTELAELLRPFTSLQDEAKPSGKASKIYDDLLHIITRTTGLDTYTECNKDTEVQEKRIETMREVGKLLSAGIPHHPLGSCERHLLSLAITTNNRTLIPLLLAAGLPLTTMDSGLGVVQLAWYTPEITTWVGMVVTRAVVHRLLHEKSEMEEESQSQASLLNPNQILDQCIDKLVGELSGPKPWEAKFNYPNGISNKEISLEELFISACSRGATLIAWYIWRAGASHFLRAGPQNQTGLEVALARKHHYSAARLILDMRANPFIKDNMKHFLSTFGTPCGLLEILLAQEYRRLEKNLEKAKEAAEKREYLQMILLEMILFLQYISEDKVRKWRTCYSCVMDAFSEVTNDLKESAIEIRWIKALEKTLLKQTVKTSQCDISDQFYCLFYTLQSFYNNLINEKDGNEESSLRMPIKKSLRVSSEQHFPLFLHLLVSIAEVDVNLVVNDVCQTRPLHHAARNSNMSAVAYLLESGGSPSVKDRFQFLPADYAYMFGHQGTGDYISRFKNINVDNVAAGALEEHFGNDMSECDYLEAFEVYLKQNDLITQGNARANYQHVKTYEELLAGRLWCVKKTWEEKGIRKAVADITVDNQEKEAKEIRENVKAVLEDLAAKVAGENSLYEGYLEFVGSSEDNVRLYCPDEYDCNLVLNKMNEKQSQEISITFVELDDEKAFQAGHRQSLNVTFSDELDDVMKESTFLNEFFNITEASLKKIDFQNVKLRLLIPGIKRTQVGVALSFLWSGEKYPMLFVDVDFVPTLRAPWSQAPHIPTCGSLCRDLKYVFLNSVGDNGWRFSFGQAETQIMKRISVERREVFLACKFILASLKTEHWVPLSVKSKFEYWDSRFFSLPAKGGFALKNSFFRELEEVRDSKEWETKSLLSRMCSIFERMCKLDATEKTIDGPSIVKAYFGGDTEKASFYQCAPDILKFLRNLDKSIIERE